MSYAFAPVGKHWINLELVISVELLDDPARPGTPVAVRVHHSTGQKQDFHGAAEVKDLVDFLTAHRAK